MTEPKSKSEVLSQGAKTYIKSLAKEFVYGFNEVVTSKYMDKGLCADISCRDSQTRYELIKLAYKHGITRIGVAKTFIHIGLGTSKLPNNVMWDYS